MEFGFAKLVAAATDGNLGDIKDALMDVAGDKALELIAGINLLLRVLQDAGYTIHQLNIEAAVSPKITVELKLSQDLDEGKLHAALKQCEDKFVVHTVLSALIQANKLRDAVSVDAIDLDCVSIELDKSPNIVMKWKSSTAAAVAKAGKVA